MTENVLDELYQLKSEHAKGVKLCVNMLELEVEKRCETCFNVNNKQNRTISELYADDKNIKYSSKPKDILKSTKSFNEQLGTKREPPKVPLLIF